MIARKFYLAVLLTFITIFPAWSQIKVTPSAALVKSNSNSTATPLTAGASFVGDAVEILFYHQIHYTLFFRPNQIPSGDASTAKASLFFEFSPDLTNWDISVPIVIRSGINIPQTLVTVDRYFRIRYLNDGGVAAISALGLSDLAGTPTAQTEFRLNTYLVFGGTKELGRTIDQGISGSDPVSLVRSVIMGKSPDDMYLNVGVNEQGDLLTSDFLTEVAKGNIPGHELKLFSGYNADIDVAAQETVFDFGGTHIPPLTPTTVTLVSTSILDNGVIPNTGARTVVIEGLDNNYAEIKDTVTVNGIVNVLTDLAFLAVNNAYVLTFGATGANQGTITGIIGGAVQFAIIANYNRAQIGYYTILAGKTAYLIDVGMGMSNNTSSNLHGFLYIRSGTTGSLQVIDNYGGHSQGANAMVPYKAPVRIPEKSYIRLDAAVGANNSGVNCQANLLIVTN